MSLIEKYKNVAMKYVETPLPVQHLLYPDKVPQIVRVYPFTVQVELKHFESLLTIIENAPIQFIMFEDIIDDLVQDKDGNKIDTNYLTLQDIQYIIYSQRLLTFGNEMKVKISCDNCRRFYIEQKEVINEKDKLEQLKKKYNIKNLLEQELLKMEDFYQDEVIIDLSKMEMATPNSKDEITSKTLKTTTNVVISFTIPRLGVYRKMKEYLIDFRKVIEEVYKKHNIPITNQENEYELYSQFQNLQLFIDKIGEDKIDESNIFELPVLMKNLLTKREIEEINKIISEYSKYILRVPYVYRCPRCGTTKEVDGISFHYQFIFGELERV